jgi:hypothetical protein
MRLILPRLASTSTLFGCLLLAALSSGHAESTAAAARRAPAKELGSSNCSEDGSQPAACQVAWSWRIAPRAYAWIQQFDPSTREWLSVAVAPATRSGVSQDAVEDGHLYRVMGCDDPQGSERCASTTVFWAPYRPATVNDIPEVVVDRYGGQHTVSKNTPYEAQIAEYNVYQLMLHLEGLDRSVMPAMTRPKPETMPDWSVWDTVNYNIHNVYEGYRAMDAEVKAHPHEQPSADWWRGDTVR